MQMDAVCLNNYDYYYRILGLLSRGEGRVQGTTESSPRTRTPRITDDDSPFRVVYLSVRVKPHTGKNKNKTKQKKPWVSGSDADRCCHCGGKNVIGCEDREGYLSEASCDDAS